MNAQPTRIFISYSHDSQQHMDRVLELSDRLRAEGIDCQIDQYEQSPPEGWQTWCMNQAIESDFVLVICTETYERRFRNKEEEGKGKGVTFEGYIITQAIYDNQSRNVKFIPVILSSVDFPHVPLLLKGPSIYDISSSESYDELYRRLTNQPRITKPKLGQVKSMPPRSASGSAPVPKLERKQEFLKAIRSVPHPPNVYFTGREATLEEVRKKLLSQKRAALSGMRGVGKTRAAVEYVYRHRGDYQAILWARAETRDTLAGDYAAIARLLDLRQKDEKEQSVVIAAVKSWLEANNNCLLVLDNVDDLSLMQEFVPPAYSGHLLLTTTAQAVGQVPEKIKVEKMNEGEGALLLLRRAKVIGPQAPMSEASAADQKNARQLAKELDGLPLALDQAGAFIEETPSTLDEYRKLYQKEGKRLRKERGELGGEHPSVTVTFSIAFAELTRRDAIAADLVRLCAFLAPDAIPEEVFTKGGSALGERFANRVANPLDFVETLKQAAKFSLIQRDVDDHSVDIHRVVQEVLKDEIDENKCREWAERAVRAVNSTLPDPEFPNWPACERLLPHAKACAAIIEEFSFAFEEAARLLNKTAFYIDDRAQYVEAEPLYQRALTIWEKALGLEHPDVATSLNNLAVLYRNQGRYTEAEPLHQRAMTIWEKALGQEHPDVATSLNNLAELYRHQARYKEAEPLHQRALAIREKVLGSEHADVALSLNNLALVYEDQGRLEEAEPLFKRALAIWEKVLGLEHPNVATSLNNLAVLYDNGGRYEEAEPLFKRALAIREKALGLEHPSVANNLNNLAALYDNRERYEEAEPLFKRALAIWEKALGLEHPSVATSLNNLAALYRKQGRYEEAKPLYRRALAIREKSLGPEHPLVASVLENYAVLLRYVGREAEAAKLGTRAKSIREKHKNQNDS
jgi:tetratricopeptide (TPR) repeat protein